MPRRTVQRLVPAGRTRRSMAGWVGFPDVRLGLDDDAAGLETAPVVDEDSSDQIARDLEGRPVVERSRELHGDVAGDSVVHGLLGRALDRLQPRDGPLGSHGDLRIAVADHRLDDRKRGHTAS